MSNQCTHKNWISDGLCVWCRDCKEWVDGKTQSKSVRVESGEEKEIEQFPEEFL